MPSPASERADEFEKHVQRLESTRRKMEDLVSDHQIDLDDIEEVYRGLYLNLITAFEGFLERLFFGLLDGEVESQSCCFLPDVAKGAAARNILLIDRDYLEWLPYDHAIERAKAFFQDGCPFTFVKDEPYEMQHRSALKKYLIIRNTIAHMSDFSREKFETNVIGDLTLTPRERTPAGFLRHAVKSQEPNERILNEF